MQLIIRRIFFKLIQCFGKMISLLGQLLTMLDNFHTVLNHKNRQDTKLQKTSKKLSNLSENCPQKTTNFLEVDDKKSVDFNGETKKLTLCKSKCTFLSIKTL